MGKIARQLVKTGASSDIRAGGERRRLAQRNFHYHFPLSDHRHKWGSDKLRWRKQREHEMLESEYAGMSRFFPKKAARLCSRMAGRSHIFLRSGASLLKMPAQLLTEALEVQKHIGCRAGGIVGFQITVDLPVLGNHLVQ